MLDKKDYEFLTEKHIMANSETPQKHIVFLHNGVPSALNAMTNPINGAYIYWWKKIGEDYCSVYASTKKDVAKIVRNIREKTEVIEDLF